MKDDRGNRQGEYFDVLVAFLTKNYSFVAYFGTGESFLFSLYPERAKYPWVGIDSDQNVDHASELFMAADSKMLTIGGG